MATPIASKIPDSGLRDFVGHKHDGVRSVIVEAGTDPQAERKVNSVWDWVTKGRGSRRAPPQKSTGQPQMNELARMLRRLDLKEKPTRLNMSHAFVVKADARQLKAIAESPFVEVIRPNRTHRTSR